MSNCKLSSDIESKLNDYRQSCDKKEYHKLSLLVHPDKNLGCNEEAVRHMATLSKLKDRCALKNSTGCKYKKLRFTLEEEDPSLNFDGEEDIYLWGKQIGTYGSTCNVKNYNKLKSHLLVEENKDCEKEAKDAMDILEEMKKDCRELEQAEVEANARKAQVEARRAEARGQQLVLYSGLMSSRTQSARPMSSSSQSQKKRSPQKRRSPQKKRSPQKRKSSQRRRSPSRSKSPSNSSLKAQAKKLGCRGYSKLTKAELIKFIKKCKKIKESPRTVSKSTQNMITVAQLRAQAKKLGCRGYSQLNKAELIRFIKKC